MSPADSTPRRVTVRLFAVLREQAGRGEWEHVTAAATPAELYAELRQEFPLALEPELVRVAVNGAYADPGRPLAAGDEVVFIPPVTGG
jgi:molybdopterin converting factor subunit 1